VGQFGKGKPARRSAARDSPFFADLGGESIDLLDLQFQIAKQLGVQVEFEKLLGGDAIKTDEHKIVTPESLKWLAQTYPFLPFHRLAPNPTPEGLKALLTVEAITRVVELAQVGSLSPATP
jgi:acyl carrier protein